MNRLEFDQKESKLNQARLELKEMFFGIDSIIDQLMESVGAWYHFSSLQNRPMVINLWGLTGVGKSELIRQTVKILGLDKRFYQFDCGEMYLPRTSGLRDRLKKIFNFGEPVPSVLLLDEFQMNRTIDENGIEKTQTGSRILWKLLDDGKIDFDDYSSHQEDRFIEIYDEYRFWIKSGLKIKDGLVDPSCVSFLKERSTWDLFSHKTTRKLKATESDRFILPSGDVELIFNFVKHKYRSINHFNSFLHTVNEDSFWGFLNECMESMVKPKTVDLSVSLIFVAGNLDEAFRFSKNQTSDISPDEFYRESLKIKLPDIKQALQYRFREEQIGRLGNNHLIFPCLNSEAYGKIIEKELEKLSNQVSGMIEVKFLFDESVNQWLFEEGVAPTQGVRPLLSSIKYSIGDLIPKIIKSYFELGKEIDLIRVSISKEVKVQYLKAGKQDHSQYFPIQTKIKNLKKNRGDDFQSLVAVHESGHAIVQIALTGKIPVNICSVTSDKTIGGMIQTGFERKYYTYTLLQEEVTILLGGYFAEMELFGANHVSDGSSGDLGRATSLTMQLFKEAGFDHSLLKFARSNQERGTSFHDITEIEKRASGFIESAGSQTQEILKRERVLLVEMAKVLSDNAAISSMEIMELVKKFGSNEIIIGINKIIPGLRETLFQQSEKYNEVK